MCPGLHSTGADHHKVSHRPPLAHLTLSLTTSVSPPLPSLSPCPPAWWQVWRCWQSWYRPCWWPGSALLSLSPLTQQSGLSWALGGQLGAHSAEPRTGAHQTRRAVSVGSYHREVSHYLISHYVKQDLLGPAPPHGVGGERRGSGYFGTGDVMVNVTTMTSHRHWHLDMSIIWYYIIYHGLQSTPPPGPGEIVK